MSNCSVTPIRLGVAILGAGASSRMGTPKLLLPWGAATVMEHLIALWRALGTMQVAVVCAPPPGAVEAELDRLGFPKENRILNSNPERGMFSSVQCAARWNGWNPALTHWAFVLGDQPHVKFGTLKQVLDFAAANVESICQPSRHSRPRHPVIVPGNVLSRLAASEAAHLKRFLLTQSELTALCEIDDPALDLDLDTPEDYKHVLRAFPPAESDRFFPPSLDAATRA